MDPENVVVPERVGKNLQKKISDLEAVALETQKKVTELERVVKALLGSVHALEEEQGEAYMPAGQYYGMKFDE